MEDIGRIPPHSVESEQSILGSILLDKDAFLVTPKGKEKVHCLGINDDGLLIIEDSLGNTRDVLSGEITFHK